MATPSFYYQFKPLIPRRLQVALRRTISKNKRKLYAEVWPIHPEAGDAPEGWVGWPGGKKFALVLMHDVDSAPGQKNVLNLMNLERELGFKSCFNFVPEGYKCDSELRTNLRSNGFGIGVHGLTHEGQVFQNRRKFEKAIPKINKFLAEWSTSMFSSPSMLGNLDWISHLNIECDCSTFDTDPFEPQANDIETIFPLIIINSDKTRSYVELPYTLPQDHCLFIILQEKDISIWKKKLDWIAEKGGMALLNTHPDYMQFPGQDPKAETYPSEHYRDFLLYVKNNYQNQYWNTLPVEVARFWKEKMGHHQFVLSRKYRKSALSHLKKTIWIDLDNTPHVPFFIPIKRELKRRNHRVLLTARDAFQVKELAQQNGLFFKTIGRHYGKSKAKKLIGWFIRSLQLMPFIIRYRPSVALSHGSRSQIFAANLFRIPTILIIDYEHSRPAPFSYPKWMIVPEVLKEVNLISNKILTYQGLKEDVYVAELQPDPSLLAELGISDQDILITVRPPATEAHYHNPAGEDLFYESVDWLFKNTAAKVVILPRNQKQGEQIKRKRKSWFTNGRIIIPGKAIDGLNLIYFSDLVISGGGTMNREAAALGVPVYSIFRGPVGLIDKKLEEEGRLTFISKPEELSRVKLEKRQKTSHLDLNERPALSQIIKNIEFILKEELKE
ncbi:MAG: DUF354 domain-containing protein [Candidatus Saccharicenans sp.]